jgi:hypothetical protein
VAEPFVAEAHRQSALVASSDSADDEQAFVDALSADDRDDQQPTR